MTRAIKQRVLVTVKTYPTLSKKYGETVAHFETPQHDLFGVSCDSSGEIISIRDLAAYDKALKSPHRISRRRALRQAQGPTRLLRLPLKGGVIRPSNGPAPCFLTVKLRLSAECWRTRDLYRQHRLGEPLIDVSESWVTTTFRRPVTESEEEVGDRSALSRHQVQILRNCLTEKAIGTLMASVSRKDRTKFRNQVLNPLLEGGWLEMTIPDKPTSSKQEYRLTSKGRQLLAELGEDDV